MLVTPETRKSYNFFSKDVKYSGKLQSGIRFKALLHADLTFFMIF